jgi:hypothetical protein
MTGSTLAKSVNAMGRTIFGIIFDGPHAKATGLYMGTFTMGHREWADLYPVQSRMIDGFEDAEEAVILLMSVVILAIKPNCCRIPFQISLGE